MARACCSVGHSVLQRHPLRPHAESLGLSVFHFDLLAFHIHGHAYVQASSIHTVQKIFLLLVHMVLSFGSSNVSAVIPGEHGVSASQLDQVRAKLPHVPALVVFHMFPRSFLVGKEE